MLFRVYMSSLTDLILLSTTLADMHANTVTDRHSMHVVSKSYILLNDTELGPSFHWV